MTCDSKLKANQTKIGFFWQDWIIGISVDWMTNNQVLEFKLFSTHLLEDLFCIVIKHSKQSDRKTIRDMNSGFDVTDDMVKIQMVS